MLFYSYGISVGLGHITAFLPYISDTGVLAPERSVFSQLINIAAFLHMTTVYIRFRHVNLEIKTRWNEPEFCGRCVYYTTVPGQKCLSIPFIYKYSAFSLDLCNINSRPALTIKKLSEFCVLAGKWSYMYKELACNFFLKSLENSGS